MQVTKEVKKNIFTEFGGAETNTGSTEAQVALFTSRINHISDHLKTNRKDHSNTRALLIMVGKRKRLLNYLAKKNLNGYRALIAKLGIRK
jgi:small subunit ribosomal protein S15